VIGGSVITVLVIAAPEVVTIPPLIVTVVSQVSLKVTVTGSMVMVVGLGSTKGGRMRVQGG
jgi:hypothetical protein